MTDQLIITLIGILVTVIVWLGGMLFAQRNPQGLAATVETQQKIINNMQKEIGELKVLVKARRIRFNAVIVVDEEVYIESSGVEMVEAQSDNHPPTRPHSFGKKTGLGGMRT